LEKVRETDFLVTLPISNIEEVFGIAYKPLLRVMPSEPEIPSQGAGESEEELCVSCMFPNVPEAHFCAKCGAPLSSYASTGPFEHLFAEGHVYRQAAESPRRFIVVLGIWMIFGAFALTGVVLVAFGRDSGFGWVLVGALTLALSLVMIAKTTRNYFTGRKSDESRDG
jgi:hypothetical protein